MESIGIYDAKARLSELVERAEAGHAVTITRHGRPVARLVPARLARLPDRAALMDEIAAFAKTVRLRKPFDLRKAIEWGRR
ncbi:MAG: type II toxin-antitoxin system prevent-host-death family antitoxin [Betaproteobacteria bacterium]|nr:type II toxin-antitoxin system prevent-host-death family antitoxin [Betaproteobacteria bacterium]